MREQEKEIITMWEDVREQRVKRVVIEIIIGKDFEKHQKGFNSQENE